MAWDAIWHMVVCSLVGLGSVIGTLASAGVVCCFFPLYPWRPLAADQSAARGGVERLHRLRRGAGLAP